MVAVLFVAQCGVEFRRRVIWFLITLSSLTRYYHVTVHSTSLHSLLSPTSPHIYHTHTHIQLVVAVTIVTDQTTTFYGSLQEKYIKSNE